MLLECSDCAKTVPNDSLRLRCTACGEPLDTPVISNCKITPGDKLTESVLSRYREFFPFLDLTDDPCMGEGKTALIRDEKLAAEVGVAALFLKNETTNPTWSFKDRGTATGIIHAKNLGYDKIGTVSTGNMA